MQDQKAQTQAYNNYKVAQLSFSLDPDKLVSETLPLIHELSPAASTTLIQSGDSDQDSSRRMSSSALSSDSSTRPVHSQQDHQPAPYLSHPPTDRLLKRPPSDAGSPPGSRHGKPPHGTWNDTHGHPMDNGHAGPGVDSSKVSLPSIFTSFEDPFRPNLRRTSAPILHPSDDRRYTPYRRRTNDPTSLTHYQYPSPMESADRSHFGPGGPYGAPAPETPMYSANSTPSTGISHGHFYSPQTPEYNPRANSQASLYGTEPWSAAGPMQGAPRSGSSGVPMSPPQMYGSAARISGQVERRGSTAHKDGTAGPEDSQWSYPAAVVPSNAPASTNSSSTASAPAPRKRGKLPKETTDYLKSWLHRHSEHPYPSEDEKKQLCSATGLSMSQVSNWMINARRRILAPANRLATNPSTTTPISGTGPAVPPGPDRRLSAPTEALQLYHPLSLQTLPASPPQPRLRTFSGPGVEYSDHMVSAHPSSQQGPTQSFGPPPMSAPANFPYPDWNTRPTYSQPSSSSYPQHNTAAPHGQQQGPAPPQ